MGQWLAALSIREEGPRCVQKSGFPDSHNSSTDSIHQIPVSQADLLPVFLNCSKTATQHSAKSPETLKQEVEGLSSRNPAFQQPIAMGEIFGAKV
jgi:hypothetical protein